MSAVAADEVLQLGQLAARGDGIDADPVVPLAVATGVAVLGVGEGDGYRLAENKRADVVVDVHCREPSVARRHHSDGEAVVWVSQLSVSVGAAEQQHVVIARDGGGHFNVASTRFARAMV